MPSTAEEWWVSEAYKLSDSMLEGLEATRDIHRGDIMLGYNLPVKDHHIDISMLPVVDKIKVPLLIIHDKDMVGRGLFKRKRPNFCVPYYRYIQDDKTREHYAKTEYPLMPRHIVTVTLENGYAWVIIDEKYLKGFER